MLSITSTTFRILVTLVQIAINAMTSDLLHIMTKKQRKAISNRNWFLRNREHALELQRAWIHADPNRIKIKNLRRRYGITLEQFDAMVKKQNRKCGICFAVKPLSVDHCHKTGKIRKLLCRSCNSRLGWFEARKSRILSYIK